MARLSQLAIVCAFLCLCFATSALLWRRAGGSIESPIGVVGLAFTCFIAAVAWTTRRWFVNVARTRDSLLCVVLPTLTLLLLATAVSDVRTWLVTIGVWSVVATEEFAWWSLVLRHRAQHIDVPADSTAEDEPHEGDVIAFNPDASQSVERSGHAGAETITGLYRVSFASGEQTADLYISFCPPLRSLPEVHAWQIEDIDCRIKIVETRLYGVHVEVRRMPPISSAETIVVQLTANEASQAEPRETQYG